MSCDLTSGVSRACKTSLGGIEKLYLTSYVEYADSQFDIDGVYLVEMPVTIVYEYDIEVMSFTETTEKEAGASYFNQSLTFEVPFTSDLKEVYKMIDKKTRAFIIDRNGKIRAIGLKNGLDANYTEETGTGKTDLNGYRITLTGKEDKQAYYMDSLEGGGVITEENVNYLFQSGDNFVYNDGVNNYVFN